MTDNVGLWLFGTCLLFLLFLGLAGCDARIEPSDEPAAGLQVGRLLGEDAVPEGFARALPGTRLVFPRDHGPHPNYRSEWWYLTLMLKDAQGREFGGQFTLFRQAQQPGPLVPANPWLSSHLYMAHLAVTDVAAGQHYSDERFARGHPGLAGVQAAAGELGFRAWLDGWELRSHGAQFLPLSLNAQGQTDGVEFGWKLNVGLDPVTARGPSRIRTKNKVLQGQSGFSAKGPAQASFYYSYTRLQVDGLLSLDGKEVPVTGGAWLDQEWSTSVLSAGQVGWDWFAVQLDDGRDVMAFQLRREDGSRDPYDHGVLVAANGASSLLEAEDFELEVAKYWRDDAKICWPVGWHLRLLHQGQVTEEFKLEAALDDQRMATAVRYWEGLARVQQNDQLVGSGYMELTGYQPQIAGCVK